MAIDNKYAELLVSSLNILGCRNSGKKIKVACLSYLDILISESDLKLIFPTLKDVKLIKRSDSEKICRWHGINYIDVVETKSFFDALGLDIIFFDFKKFRGIEQILDLNNPISPDMASEFDLVLDTGTLEHCFNVGVAFRNMCELVNVGGLILTASPLTKINHGFWNFSPCVYYDYFNQNNWKILTHYGLVKSQDGYKKIKLDGVGRYSVPPESLQFLLVKKLDFSTNNFPIQSKYM